MDRAELKRRIEILNSVIRLTKAGYADSTNLYKTILERLGPYQADPDFVEMYRLAKGGPSLTRITFAYPHIWDRAEDLLDRYEGELEGA